MLQLDGFFELLDSRSFGTVWFWLIAVGMWSVLARNVIGVPTEVISRARWEASDAELFARSQLLDWLCLTVPRWHLSNRDGAVLMAATSFALSSLAVLGFGYDLEMAQALTLLLVPFAILFWMRVRLALRLITLLESNRTQRRPLAEITADATRHLIWHRRMVTLLAIVAVAVTAYWGLRWTLLHPNGM